MVSVLKLLVVLFVLKSSSRNFAATTSERTHQEAYYQRISTIAVTADSVCIVRRNTTGCCYESFRVKDCLIFMCLVISLYIFMGI